MNNPGAEEVSWAEVQASLRKSHKVIMDPDSQVRVLHAFKHSYRGESALVMDILRGLPVEVLAQISSAAKMMGEMAGHFKQEMEFASSADKWIGELEEPPDDESEPEEVHDYC